MKLFSRIAGRTEEVASQAEDLGLAPHGPGVVVVTGSCCIPGMAPFDQEAERRVREAIEATGVAAQVRVVSASAALGGAIPRAAMARLIEGFQQSGRMPLPAVFVNGEPVGTGVPEREALADALRHAATEISGGTK